MTKDMREVINQERIKDLLPGRKQTVGVTARRQSAVIR
jgi:hypothetical protein